jgi:divalent metal cation (Fe/Co/Zn/Cd) transporter
MDAVDPALVDTVETIVHEHSEIKAIQRLRIRWLGHRLQAELILAVDGEMSTLQAEALADHISHHLYHAVPALAETTIAAIPTGDPGKTFWRETAHHHNPS